MYCVLLIARQKAPIEFHEFVERYARLSRRLVAHILHFILFVSQSRYLPSSQLVAGLPLALCCPGRMTGNPEVGRPKIVGLNRPYHMRCSPRPNSLGFV